MCVYIRNVEMPRKKKVYDVEKIIDKYTDDSGENFYLLKWKDFPEEENTWESERDLNCAELLKEFHMVSNNSSLNYIRYLINIHHGTCSRKRTEVTEFPHVLFYLY